MVAPPQRSIPDSPAETLADVRDLISECPFLASRGPETLRRALRALRGIEASDFEVEAVLEALRVENEVLA